MNLIVNPQLKLAYDFIELTGNHVFLTGKAGTGKTTFLHELRKNTIKRSVVVAPTGVAAINAGGVTIHSFFQLPFGPQIPEKAYLTGRLSENQENEPPKKEIRKIGKKKIALIKTLDLLIIDEISMVRADLLDAIDSVLRQYKNRYKPFGGVQLLMIGDLQQLAPVVRDIEWDILRKYYNTMFFFGSLALQKTSFITIELKEIFRQKDQGFIDLLNKIRENKADTETYIELNKRYKPGFNDEADEGYIILTTHNANAQKTNEDRLNKLKGELFTYTATIEGEFPEYLFPTEPELILKVGAQVMFVKNDLSPDKLFYNGKIGKITQIMDDIIYVQCQGEPDPIPVVPVEWDNMKYTLNEETAVVDEKVIGLFTQYPLKLAWSITIHKSQGLTFDKAVIDANMAFAHGQVYVALSRCRSLEGLILNTQISNHALISDSRINEFNSEVSKNEPDENMLQQSKHQYFKSLLFELFDFSYLQKLLDNFVRSLSEHQQQIIYNQPGKFLQIAVLFRNEVTEVAMKFRNQLTVLLSNDEKPEDNELLKERITKACNYFEAKIQAIIIEPFKNFKIETDNKTIKKHFNEIRQKLDENFFIKIKCIEVSKQGFSITQYLQARAMAIVRKTLGDSEESKKTEPEVKMDSLPHPGLFSMLKEWRKKKAENSKVPVFTILPQKTLFEICTRLPGSPHELKKIKGIGKKKLEQFGDELLLLIKKYSEQNLEEYRDESKIFPPDIKPTRENTIETTFQLFLAGKTVNEIAAERKMTLATIEGHLAKLIRSGKIKINQVVPYDQQTQISEYFLKTKNRKLAPAKEELGDTISYSALKYVVSHLIFTGELQAD